MNCLTQSQKFALYAIINQRIKEEENPFADWDIATTYLAKKLSEIAGTDVTVTKANLQGVLKSGGIEYSAIVKTKLNPSAPYSSQIRKLVARIEELERRVDDIDGLMI